ncbi:hypothetical protein [Tengunoibacter tsumagoiensis]|uniref:Uncharacterized protein n=1 Tax=Tengunoibacter tsumagoiensis TaxID=2014871 RepID=A0A401ZV47_9CHLR|nr:hypothetical protein [Tengunoibacter tsumagoiensis]GCE10594.1 hypothetical protein KTT_04530 [Tengunoibacter tsumagoiensis]
MSERNPPYVSYLYIERHNFTQEWLLGILHYLWRHGLSFSPFAHVHGTWEEQLQASDFQIQGIEASTLQEALHCSLSEGSIYITFWDGNLEYDLYLDPQNLARRQEAERYVARETDEQEKQVWIETLQELEQREPVAVLFLYCDQTTDHDIFTEMPETTNERLYLRSYRGHLHWTKKLCEYVQPLFAFNTPNRFHRIPEDEELVLWLRLANGEQPDALRYLSLNGNCYLPQHLVTKEFLSAALEIPTCTIERLSTGGVFCSVRDGYYAYESNQINWHYYMAYAHCYDGDPRFWPEEKLHECLAHVKRSYDLSLLVGNKDGAYSARNLQTSIDKKLQRRDS